MFIRLELGKIYDRIEKLEQMLDATRKLVKKISEGLAGRTGQPVVISGGNSDVSREEFDKLRSDLTDLATSLDNQKNRIKEELDLKASLHDLANL